MKFSLPSPLSSSHEPVHRLLRIYVDECKTLSSKERCPFLICMETVQTAFNGCDPQLYAGNRFVGVSLREVLGEWQNQRLNGTSYGGAEHAATQPASGSARPTLRQYMPSHQWSSLLRSPSAPEQLSKLHIWAERRRRIHQSSPFRHLPGWNVQTAIVKVGDDVRKDALAMQAMTKMMEVMELANVHGALDWPPTDACFSC